MKKILVVDDSNTVLEMIKNELKNHSDIQAYFARSQKEAMRIIREQQGDIHAALLDYNLPDAPNGEVVSLANSHQIPSVVLTGTLDAKVKDIILKKNVVDFVLKDNPESIYNALSSIKHILKNYDSTVLLVDDSKLSRELVKMHLEGMHLNVVEAENGQEALDIIKSGKPQVSLVITDYEMPKMDGLDLTFALREIYNKSQLGIIAISASENEDIINKFLKFGTNDFIRKPFSPNEVITTINANLELLNLFEQIKDQANKDFLTGAYNRRYFFDSGNAIFLKARRKKASIAVAMIDIDKFKNINDTYGHDVGDIAIKEIKCILDMNLRKSDLMARFGGEEFCILLEDISVEDTKKVFEKIRRNFEENVIDANGIDIRYTVSFGVAYGMAGSLDEMVKLSDEALYYAKENGRNQVTINIHSV